MERSDKQQKPVAIKNLAELKRFIQPGVEFKTLSQKNHPDLVGLTRVVTTVQTVCFYSKIKDQPNSRFSTDNGGKGFRTDFAKADAYVFDGTTVKVKDTRNKDRGVIYEFEFYDGEQTMQEDTNMDRKMVNFIKEQYPPGTRIRLNSMEDPYAPIAPGTEGEVDFVDDIGTIHMKWDNGRALGIVPGEDSFSVLPPKLTTLKLYMPLTADFYERSEYGDLEPESTELDGHALQDYQDQIMAELVKNRMPEETERGLMHWYASKYALSERLVCGECGTLYRRCTWTRNGEKRVVWRCVSRLDYGKKYCHNSPTLDEAPLQQAILAALNTAMADKNSLIRQITDAMETEIIPFPGGTMSLGDIERRLRELEQQFQTLLEKATDDPAAYGGQFKEILDEQTFLKEKRSGILADNKEQAKANQRIIDAAQTLENASPHITEWDESAVRQLVETVKVLSKDEIAVTLKGGIEIRQKVMY